MKQENYYVIAMIVLVISVVCLTKGGPTGAVIAEQAADVKTLRLHEHALRFFDVDDIVFPQGVCMPTAHELYGNIAYESLAVYAGYSSSSAERISTLSFVVDRHERYGTIDFVKSPTFLADKDADSLISISSEAIVRVPKADRTTYLVMDLYGKTKDRILYITKGRFSTPSTDCIFLLANGKAYCDCDMHTIKGIAVGGVTAAPAVEERYQQIVKEAEETGIFGEKGVITSKADVIN